MSNEITLIQLKPQELPEMKLDDLMRLVFQGKTVLEHFLGYYLDERCVKGFSVLLNKFCGVTSLEDELRGFVFSFKHTPIFDTVDMEIRTASKAYSGAPIGVIKLRFVTDTHLTPPKKRLMLAAQP